MVTRKTRVLSAFAALLMLVSLFTCFCLPATAAVATQPSNLTAYKNRTASDTAKDYAITDTEDWLRFVADSNGNADYGPLKSSTPQPFSGYNLWLTNDLDFKNVNLDVDGDGTVEIHEFCVSTDTSRISGDNDYFYGNFYGQGHAIKNLVVDVKPDFKSGACAFGLFTYTSTAKIMDLTIDKSCSFIVRNAVNGVEAFVGVFCGNSANNAWFINCKNEASLDLYDEGSNKTNSISVFGRKQRGYMVNCINTGALTNHDGGRVTVFAEWMNSSTSSRIVYLYNCVNTGVLINNNEVHVPGLVSTNGTDAIVTQNQIRLYNTYAVGCHIGSHNDYTMIDDLDGGRYWEQHGVEQTGELAYLMNKGYDTKYDGTYGRAYYTVKDENIAFGTAAEQPMKLNFSFGTEKETIYAVADASGKLNLAELYPLEGGVYAPDAGTLDGNLLTATPGSEINVEVTSTQLIYTYLQNAIDFFNGKNVAYYKDSNGVALTADVLSTMQNKINNEAYEDQATIDADIATLDGYTFDKSTLIPIGEFDTYRTEAVKFSIASKADMETLAELASELEEDVTLCITANIDMEGSDANRYGDLYGLKASIDGGNKTIENLYVTNAFLPSYLGAYVKDLTFKNGNVVGATANTAFLVDKVTTDLTVSNVTLDGVVSESTATGGGMQGVLICQLTNDAELKLEDITIVDSTMTRPAGTDYWNSGLVLGKTYGAKLLIDGVYLNGNTVDGERTGGTGRGIAIGEIICNAEVKNMVVLNTTAVDGNVSAIIAAVKEHGTSYDVDPTITIGNIIAYNNGEETNFSASGSTSAGSTITFKNIYSDTAKILSNTTYEGYTVEASCVADAAAAITSGEAAWMLNKALAGDKWTMVNGLPALGTEENQTIRVAVEMDGFETEYLYANLNQETILVHSVPGSVFSLKNADDSATVTGSNLIVTGVPAEELTISVVATLTTMSFDALDAKIAEIGDKAAFYLDATGTKTVVADLEAIKARRATEYAGFTPLDILEDLSLLNSYTLTEVDADSKATLEAAKVELEAFGENISYFVQAETMTAALATINDALDDVAADGFEALAINEKMLAAAETYNAIGERTIVEGKIVPLKLYDLFKAYNKNWSVADEEDWRAGTTEISSNSETEGMTITLLNDIDMTADGDDSAVLPLAYTKYFNGVLDGQGHVFKNLKIDVTVTEGAEELLWVGLVGALGKTGVVKNVGLESGSITVTSGVSLAARVGTVVGYGGNGSVIQNCWNAATVTYKMLEGARADSYTGGVVGSATAWSTIDGCYNVGAVYSEGAHAAGINGWAQTGSTSTTHGRVYNSFNAGTVTSVKNPTYIGAVRTGGGSVGGVANTYAIGTKLVFIAGTAEEIAKNDAYVAALTQNNDTNSNLPAEIYTTGELAWMLNRGYTEGYSNHTTEGLAATGAKYPLFINYEEIQPYYTMKDGKTVLGTEENQTIRVTIKHDGIENYIYVNADAENYDLGRNGIYELESGAAEIINDRYLNIDSPEDVVVTVVIPGIGGNHVHADCMDYTNNNDGTHTSCCDYEVTIDERAFTCDYVGETVACSEFTYAVDQASINAETHAHQSVATCTACGHSAPAADCTAGFEENVTGTPDCVNPGEKTFTCKNDCGYSYTELIPENGHKEDYTPAGNNQHTVTCKNCTILNKLENCTPDEDGWTETVAPSVDTFGEKKTTCTVCGGDVIVQIAKLTAAMVTAGINEEETEVTATVALLNNPGVDSVTVKVAFDYTIMELKEVVAENGYTVGTPIVENGVVTFTVTGEIKDDLNVAVATFTMKTEEGELVASNRDYKLKVTATADETVELEGSEDTFTVTKGKDIVKGDMTGDKVVDLSDAILLIRYISGTELPEGYAGTITDAMADLTDEGDGVDLGDGQITPEVNTNDVLYLLRYLNGWTDVL